MMSTGAVHPELPTCGMMTHVAKLAMWASAYSNQARPCLSVGLPDTASCWHDCLQNSWLSPLGALSGLAVLPYSLPPYAGPHKTHHILRECASFVTQHVLNLQHSQQAAKQHRHRH